MAVVTKGILGRKLGMTQIFDDAAKAIPVTAIEVGPCRVTSVRTPENDGYSAIQLAFGEVKEAKLNKPQLGHLRKVGAGAHRHLVEIRVADATPFTVGQELRADVFTPGDRADVVGTSKGKGFAGVMKRHGFHGAPGSHGTERKHRTPGSIGAGTTPHHVFKGRKMPGRMGGERVTVIGLEVVRVDPERNLLLVKGAVPGPVGGIVVVRSTVRGRQVPYAPPTPTQESDVSEANATEGGEVRATPEAKAEARTDAGGEAAGVPPDTADQDEATARAQESEATSS